MDGNAHLDLLAAHADALNETENVEKFDTEAWLSRYPLTTANVSSWIPLLELAKAIKRVLVPVQPSTLFRSELRRQLVQGQLPRQRRRFRTVWLGAAVIGSLLSFLGLLLILLRRLKLDDNSSQPATTAV